MSKEVKRVNMNGSDDPYYRYTMPCIAIKVEGTTKMIKTVLVNIDDVCRAIGRPPDYLLTFLGQELSANSKIEKETEKAYVTGAMEEKQIQALIFKFIQETVQCGNCKGPETTVHIEGSKKNKTLFLTCKGCGSRTDLDSNERFVKYMILHPPTDANYGHAKTAAGAVGSAMAEATALDEAAKKKKKNKGEDAEDDDAEKKEKKKKKKKDKDAEDEEDSPDGEDKKEKKKKKKKDKDADEEEDEEGGDKKEKKKKKKKDKEKKKDDDGGDSWDDDWGEDTSPEAVAARQANLGGSGATEDKLEKKMEAVKVAQKNDDDSDDDDGPAAGATAAKPEDDDDDDLDIDDI
mmetsp:Transcript_47865/g.95900  ORF Transcript_47865/g.95900 Transcript_47865/m.95900 type:complete len:347 (-) Transcript_47865:117-1157(-)